MIEKNEGAKTIWHILEIADLLKKYGDVICAKQNITTQQWLILLYLGGDPNIPYFEREPHFKPMMASELAEAFNVSRPNITNLLNGLIKKDLIIQIEDDLDRRKKRLRLTEKGEKLLEGLEPGRKEFNENFLSDLDQGQRKNFLEWLENCNRKIIDRFAEFTHK